MDEKNGAKKTKMNHQDEKTEQKINTELNKKRGKNGAQQEWSTTRTDQRKNGVSGEKNGVSKKHGVELKKNG